MNYSPARLDNLTPIESALVRALVGAIVRELKDERPERLGIAAGRGVRDEKDREQHDSTSSPTT